jgi:predicted TIM-barrel fold metal-dependent hydrolase
MIIDAHTHIFPDEMRKDREAFCARDEGFATIYRNPKARMVGVKELISSMDEAGVERSVVCGFSWGQPELCALHNQYLLESATQYPNRLIVFISLLLTNPDWSARELEGGVQEGAKGVGEIAFYHHEMTSQDIDAMKPTLSLMEKKGIPLLLHTNENVGHPYPGKGMTRLERFYEIILAFPGLTLLLAHWGGGLPFYELMPEGARAMSNVYYDTAASPFLYSKKIYAVISQMVGPEKILFGSDFPLILPQRYLQELKGSGLPVEDQEKILGLNISRVLGLEIGVNECNMPS